VRILMSVTSLPGMENTRSKQLCDLKQRKATTTNAAIAV
jgi:hypothetical protein